MSFNPMFGTGFEMGCVPFLTSDLVAEEYGVHATYDGISAHSGNYMFRLRNGDVKIDVAGTQKEIYISVWHHPLDNFSSGNDTWIRIVLTDGNYLELRKFAGNKFDEAIMRYMRKKHNMMIGERTAEDLKVNIGSAYPLDQEKYMDARGRNLVSGLPKTIKVSSSEIREAIEEPVAQIADAVHSVLEKTPPELAADISDKGIVMAGGASLLGGLDKLLQKRTGIPVYIAEDSISCVAVGTGKALEHFDVLASSVLKKDTMYY